MIPPSIGFVVFGVAAGVSITRLFLAGIVPGILMALALVITWYIVARDEPVARPQRAEPARDRPRRRSTASGRSACRSLIIGGMKVGVFTPTEAAVVAAVYAAFVGGFVYRELKLAASAPGAAGGAQDLGCGDVPGRGGPGLGLADHHRRHSRPRSRACSAR